VVPDYPDFSAHDGRTRAEPALDPPTDGTPTAIELHRRPAPTPMLRLVTGDTVAETRHSGALAGRGPVELALPQVPTVSREHARFVYASGQWWITNLGRNGLSVNGVPLDGDRPLSTGDVIRWGSRAAALQSWVEIK
jgi:FHA domain